MSETQPHNPQAATEIVAHRGEYYRNTRILVTGMVLVMGGWFLYDGLIGYPRYNEKFEHSTPTEQVRMEKPHQDRDIQIQLGLGFGLLPVGLLLALWFWYASRGTYQLAGETLTIPGHPPIPLTAITEVDKSKWERKGIAYIDYCLPDGETGSFKLDDFVYQRKPTDEILERIEQVRPATEEVAAEEPQEPFEGA